jgi:hypothetical protein
MPCFERVVRPILNVGVGLEAIGNTADSPEIVKQIVECVNENAAPPERILLSDSAIAPRLWAGLRDAGFGQVNADRVRQYGRHRGTSSDIHRCGNHEADAWAEANSSRTRRTSSRKLAGAFQTVKLTRGRGRNFTTLKLPSENGLSLKPRGRWRLAATP